MLAHLEDKTPSVAIVAAFDSDPAIADTVVHGVRRFSADHMEELVGDLGVQIAVLTVPGDQAQGVADVLVRAGVKSLISFSPVPLHLPNDIFVEYMDITAALESAAFFARLGGQRAEAESVAGIEPDSVQQAAGLYRPFSRLPFALPAHLRDRSGGSARAAV